MQIFEAIEIREYPYFLTIDVTEGELVKDVLNEQNSHKVFLLVDHDMKRIWTYMGKNSQFKLQIFGAILAGMLRKQLRLFYRIYSLNQYTYKDEEYQQILNKPLGEGRARTIEKKDFPKETESENVGDIGIHNPKINKALEVINEYPIPFNYQRVFILVRNTIYSEEEEIESFLSEPKSTQKQEQVGQLNDGFTFFNDRNYSVRFIVKNNTIQGLELFIQRFEKVPTIRLKTSIIKEDKFSKAGDINDLVNAFKIPDKLSDEEIIVHELKDLEK